MKSDSKKKTPSGRVRLVSGSDVRSLLAKTINDHRAGKVTDNAARVQGYMLHLLAKIIADTDIETRLAKLEEQQAKEEVTSLYQQRRR